MKIIKIINKNHVQNNYLIIDKEDAILIDGSANVSQIEENLKISAEKEKLQAIFLTHEHFDHISELDNLISKYNCPVYIHETGKPNLYDENKNLSCLDKPFKITKKRNIKTFKDSEEINIGDINVKCYHTPGHSMGSSCFVIEDNIFVGDNVFRTDVGRTDLFGGDASVQKISLARILNELSDGVKNFYPGHGFNFSKEELVYNLSHFLGEN